MITIILYLTVAFLELISEIFYIVPLHMITKPLLMIIMYFHVINNIHPSFNNEYRRLIKMSVIFSFFGDIFLMFVRFHDAFFMIGILFFLMLQLTYSYLYTFNEDRLMHKWKILLFLFLAGTAFYYFVINDIDEIAVAVGVYVMVLVCMMYCAIIRRKGESVLIGSILFLLSDSLIAINKFKYKIPYNGVWIMSLYIIAQYLIINGLLKI